MYNFVIIKRNGFTVTGTKETCGACLEEMNACLASSTYNPTVSNPMLRFFVGCDQYGLVEYTQDEVQDRRNWR